ncbi:unnamed protein product [Symbiodinium natans]|uniref:Uncharacterized protein n=1 Tax=Symbiodinium natans TaxID=878477 RepID=A0A812TMS6_9DINO|nr:unnamed protein product [Symbiodinium natans]
MGKGSLCGLYQDKVKAIQSKGTSTTEGGYEPDHWDVYACQQPQRTWQSLHERWLVFLSSVRWVTRNTYMKRHKDNRNDPQTFNYTYALTDFEGGGIWVEQSWSEPDSDTQEVKPGPLPPGRVYDLQQGDMVKFSPNCWHGTQEHPGGRLALITSVRGGNSLNQDDRWDLEDIGFLLPPEPLLTPPRDEPANDPKDPKVVNYRLQEDDMDVKEKLYNPL